MEQPLISVAMAVYNSEKTLFPAIKSIILQTYSNWELLIMNDGSTDSSLEIAMSFNDSRIKVFSDNNNRGLPFRLNQAWQKAKGKYFARMDSDDISYPTRFEKQVEYMEIHPDVDLLGTGILIFNDHGIPLGTIPLKLTHQEICSRPWSGFYIAHPTWLGRKDWFLQHPYDEQMIKAQDQALLFKSYKESRFACLEDILLGYRQDKRTLAKLFKSRWLFATYCSKEAIKQSEYIIAFKLLTLHSLKMVADVLNVKFGLYRLQNPILKVDADMEKQWNELWIELVINNPPVCK